MDLIRRRRAGERLAIDADGARRRTTSLSQEHSREHRPVLKHAGLRIVLRFCCVRKGLRGSDVLFGFGRAEAIRQLEQVISGSITPIVASQQNLQTGRRGCTSAPGDTLSETVEEWKGEQVKHICLPRFGSQARSDAGLAVQL